MLIKIKLKEVYNIYIPPKNYKNKENPAIDETNKSLFKKRVVVGHFFSWV